MPYIQNALTFAIETILGFYLIIAILRLLFQIVRADFRNPICQLVIRATNLPLQFLRRFIPGLFGIDLATIALIVVTAFVKTMLLLSASGYPASPAGAFVLALGESVNVLTWILIIIILASAILSWVAPMSRHPAAWLVSSMSEPLLRPFRKLIPAIQGIDLTPILALLVLNLVQRLVVHPLTDLGRSMLI